MDSESVRSRELGCWNGPTIVSSFVDQWTNTLSTVEFEPDDVYCGALIKVGFNDCSPGDYEYWRSIIKSNYQGDDGRRRLRMAGINLAQRDGLHPRLFDIRCPVLWLHVGCPFLFLEENANIGCRGMKTRYTP